MFNIIIILLATLNSEPIDSSDYRISKFILSNLDQMPAYNISQLAKACYVSPSSISRFCRKIGFQEFYELKQQFFHWEDMGPYKFQYPGKRNDDLLDSYLNSTIENLELLRNSLDKEAIHQLAREIIA